MDNDQEVVREPFDDADDDVSVHSAGQSPELNGKAHSSAEPQSRVTIYSDRRASGSVDGRADGLTGQYCYDDDDDDDSSSDGNSFVEDANFAQSFGIRLRSKKGKRCESAYDRLLNSSHIEASSSDGGAKPVIKTSITSDCVYHKGTFYQKGDIVALCDQDDRQIYFAQLTGFLQDQYCEKSASVNWLVPIQATSREFFDPSAYRLGLEDTQLRKLDCMTFVRHCPHDYYLRKYFQSSGEPSSNNSGNQQQANQSLVRGRSKTDQAYIWTTMEPCSVPPIKTK